MPITPLDINISVNKLPEISKVNRTQNERSYLSTQHGMSATQKESEKNKETVVSTKKDKSADNERRPGGNSSRRENKKSKKDKKPKDTDNKEHIIDIRI